MKAPMEWGQGQKHNIVGGRIRGESNGDKEIYRKPPQEAP